MIVTDAKPANETGSSTHQPLRAEVGDDISNFHRRCPGADSASLMTDSRATGEQATAMTDTAPATIIVRTGRAGWYADWRSAPEPLRSWHRQARCGGAEKEVFFPADEERPSRRRHRERVAKAICAACPVRLPCAAHALLHAELHGVWGGLTDTDRRHRLARP